MRPLHVGMPIRWRPLPDLEGVPAVVVTLGYPGHPWLIPSGKVVVAYIDHGVLETPDGRLRHNYHWTRYATTTLRACIPVPPSRGHTDETATLALSIRSRSTPHTRTG